MNAEKYVGAALENVEQNISKSNHHLPIFFKTPIMSRYRRETYTFTEIKFEWLTQYHTGSSPRRPLFLHAISFESTEKL